MKNENTAKFLSGFAAIVGRPNVGKSTMMNAMVGEKVAIVSNRPQTTRNRIMGVATDKDWQIVFLDTPGLHKPRTRLGEYMVKSVQDAMDGIDVLYGVDPRDRVKRTFARLYKTEASCCASDWSHWRSMTLLFSRLPAAAGKLNSF